jgi:hypothetical protein
MDGEYDSGPNTQMSDEQKRIAGEALASAEAAGCLLCGKKPAQRAFFFSPLDNDVIETLDEADVDFSLFCKISAYALCYKCGRIEQAERNKRVGVFIGLRVLNPESN